MHLRPLGDRVIIEPVTPEEVTQGGVIIPDNAQEKPQEGKVLAVGKGRHLDSGERVPVDLGVGDTVIFTKYAGNEVKWEGRTAIAITERDVIATVIPVQVPA